MSLLLSAVAASVLAVVPPADNADTNIWVAELKEKNNSFFIPEKGLAGLIQKNKSSAVSLKDPVLKREVPVFPAYFANSAASTHSPADISSLLFEDNYSVGGVPGSVRNYYRDISYGIFSLSGFVYPWVSVSQDDLYYEGPAGCNGLCPSNNTDEFITEVISANDGMVDFSVYDNDGPDGVPNSGDDDGFVDAVIIVHSESGGECGGNGNIWSHTSSLSNWTGSAYETDDSAISGSNIMVDTYMVVPVLACKSDDINKIGVFCHEFGHILGLPDLYDVDDSTKGIGTIGLMGHGIWGGDLKTPERPVQMTAWSKSFLGWISPAEIKCNGNYSLKTLSDPLDPSSNCLKLWKEGDYSGQEYFLVSNRQRIGWDLNLPLEGVVIEHVDDSVYPDSNSMEGGFDCNGVINANHFLVAIEEADGNCNLQFPCGSYCSPQDYGEESDSFRGDSPYHSFAPHTIPGSGGNYGLFTNVWITDISASAPEMTMSVDVGSCDSTAYLEPGFFAVDDSGGNSNGKAEPGEPVFLNITVYNKGTSVATEVTVHLSSLNPAVQVISDISVTEDIPPGGSSLMQNPFNVVLSENIACGTIVDFEIQISSIEGQWKRLISLELNGGGGCYSSAFPASGDLFDVNFYPVWYNVRDKVTGLRSTDMESVNRADISLVLSDNSLADAIILPISFKLNGYKIGNVNVRKGFTTITVSFAFPAVRGPDFEIVMAETASVPSGKGSIRINTSASIITLCSTNENDCDIVGSPPYASFTAENNRCVNTPVQFTDLTTGKPLSWVWDFGDGSEGSDLQNPTHVYVSPGAYSVTLTVSDADGSLTDTSPVVIDGPMVSFANPSPVLTGTSVSFASTSSGGSLPYSYVWDFGDGYSTSEIGEPQHTYFASGTYSVTLSITDSKGCIDNASAVVIAGEPFLAHSEIIIDDASGNNNGYLNPGESATIDVRIANTGIIGASDITVLLSPLSPGISIIIGTADFPDIPAETDAVSLEPHFSVSVDPSVSCGEEIYFSINIEASEGQWSDVFSFRIDGEVEKISNYAVTDRRSVLEKLSGSAMKEIAYLSGPRGICIDGDGYVVTDSSVNQLIRISNLGIVETVFSGIGLSAPMDVAVNNDGDYIVTNYGDDRITKISRDGSVLTVLAEGGLITGPVGIGREPDGSYAVVDLSSSSILRVKENGDISVISSRGLLQGPVGIAVIGQGDYAVICPSVKRLVRIREGAGQEVLAEYPDFIYPSDVDLDASREFIIADRDAGKLWRVDNSGMVSVELEGELLSKPGNLAIRNLEIRSDCDIAGLPPAASITLSSASICLGNELECFDSSAGEPSGWEWDFGDGAGVSTSRETVYVYSAPGTYTIRLTVEDADGSSTTEAEVTVYENPVAAFTSNSPAEIWENAVFVPSATGGSGFYEYEWDFGDGTPVSNEENPVHHYVDEGVYVVSLSVLDSNGCSGTFQGEFISGRPLLEYSSCIIDDSSGTSDSEINPGEAINMKILIENSGVMMATGVTVKLTVETPGVVINEGQADFPDISPGEIEESQWPYFKVELLNSVPCGEILEFKIFSETNEGQWSDIFTVRASGPVLIKENIGITDGIKIIEQPYTDAMRELGTFSYPRGADAGNGGYIVADSAANQIIKIGRDGIKENIYKGAPLSSPMDVVLAKNGDCFVTSFINDGIYRIKGDGSGIELVAQGGLIQGPVGIDLEPDGDIIVADNQSKSLLRISPTGSITPISVPGTLSGIMYVAVVEEGRFAFTSSSYSRVAILVEREGVFTLAEGEPLMYPVDIELISDGSLLIADRGRKAILRIDMNGAVTEHITGGIINSPWGLAVLSEEERGDCDIFGVPPEALFSVPFNPTCVHNGVSFINESTGIAKTWQWDFGDGKGGSSTQNPSYTYTATGTYVVELTASDTDGSDTYTETIRITDPPQVLFETDDPVDIGQAVHFSSEVTGGLPPFNYNWDFGDGFGLSTNSNPEYTYLNAGFYNAKLRVTDNAGCSVEHVKTVAVGGIRLDYLSYYFDDTSGTMDGEINPGENGSLVISIENRGTLPATGISAKLESNTPGITIIEAYADYSDLDPGEGVNCEAPCFFMSVSPEVACGEKLKFTITIDCLGGHWETAFSIRAAGKIEVEDFYGVADLTKFLEVKQGGETSQAGIFTQPRGISGTENGYVFVDSLANSIIRITPESGIYNKETIYSGMPLLNPKDVVRDERGFYIITSYGSASLIEISEDGAEVRTIASGNGITGPVGLGTEPDGDYIVVDYMTAKLLRVTLGGEISQVNVVGNPFMGPMGIAVIAEGDFVVADPLARKIFRIKENISSDIIADGSVLLYPTDIELDRNGKLLVADTEAGALIKLNLDGTVENTIKDVLIMKPWGIGIRTYEIIGDCDVFGSAPDAMFEMDKDEICLGETLSFHDLSTGEPLIWEWDFGDGTGVSTLKDPVYIYPEAGSYTVTLKVSDNDGWDGHKENVFVHLPPAAGFTSDSPVYPGEFIQFSGIASGGTPPYVFSWDFGDGSGFSSVQNPSYQYETHGTYSVVFTVTDSEGCYCSDSGNVSVVPQAEVSYFGTTLYDGVTGPDGLTELGFGNGDNIANPGETVVMAVALRNAGLVTAIAVEAEILTETGGITVLNEKGYYGDIEIGSVDDPDLPYFSFMVDSTVSCGKRIWFDVRITTVDGTLEDSFQIIISGDSIDIDGYILIDADNRTNQYSVLGVSGDGGKLTRLFEDIRLYRPMGLAIDDYGSYIITSFNDNKLVKIDSDNRMSVIYDGLPLDHPHGVDIDEKGNYIVASFFNDTIVKITPKGSLDIIASGGLIQGPKNLVVDSHGNYIVADFTSKSILKVTPFGSVSVIASGPPFIAPSGIDINSDGSYVVADPQARSLFRVTQAGDVSLLASGGLMTFPGDVLSLDPGEYMVTDELDSSIIRVNTNLNTMTVFVQNSSFMTTPVNIEFGDYVSGEDCDIYNQPPIASFYAYPNPLCANNSVAFSDTSTGIPEFWEWDFDGDGITDSTSQSPSFVYTSIGTYSARLTASDDDGSDSAVRYIKVTNNTIAADFVSNSPVVEGQPIQFINLSSGGIEPVSHEWDFGDGVGISSETDPAYIYHDADTFIVTLNLSDAGGCSSSYSAEVTVLPAPVIEYEGLIVSSEDMKRDNSLEPGEQAELSVVISNKGSSVASGIIGTLMVDVGAGISVLDGEVSYPDIDAGGVEGPLATGFIVSVDPGAVSGSEVFFNIIVDTLQGEFSFIFSVVIGGHLWGTLSNDFMRSGYADRVGPVNGCTIRTTASLGSAPSCSPVINGTGEIFIGTQAGDLYKFDKNLSTMWFVNVSSAITATPSLGVDGQIYFGTEDGRVISVQDGEVRWEYQTGGAVVASPLFGPDGMIYAGSSDSSFYALKQDGSPKWIFNTLDAVTSPAAAGQDGAIYFGSEDYTLYAVDGSGSVLWTFMTDGKIIASPAVSVDADSIYFATDNGTLYCIKSDGIEKWSYSVPSPIFSSPSIWSGGVVFAVQSGSVYALDLNGNLDWVFTPPEESVAYNINSSPAVDLTGTIYQSIGGGGIYCINSSGEEAWRDAGSDPDTGISPALHRNSRLISALPEGYLISCVDEFAVSPFGDINGDYMVDGQDLIILSRAFGSVKGIDDYYYINADLDNNGVIDGEDLSILASNFGRIL